MHGLVFPALGVGVGVIAQLLITRVVWLSPDALLGAQHSDGAIRLFKLIFWTITLTDDMSKALPLIMVPLSSVCITSVFHVYEPIS